MHGKERFSALRTFKGSIFETVFPTRDHIIHIERDPLAAIKRIEGGLQGLAQVLKFIFAHLVQP